MLIQNQATVLEEAIEVKDKGRRMKSDVGLGYPRMNIQELPEIVHKYIKEDGARYYVQFLDANYNRIFEDVMNEVAETIEDTDELAEVVDVLDGTYEINCDDEKNAGLSFCKEEEEEEE